MMILFSLSVMACGASEPDESSTTQSAVTPTIVEDTQSQTNTGGADADVAVPTASPTPRVNTPTVELPTPTAVIVDTPTVNPTQTVTPTPIPTIVPTPTPAPYVPNYVPTLTPTPQLPTPVPTATPVGSAKFTGTGSMDTTSFQSPARLPWLIEWQSKGDGPNSITISLMDPESRTEVNMIVDDSGTGELGGVNLVKGNIGTFYLHVEGPEAGWTVWIQQQ